MPKFIGHMPKDQISPNRAHKQEVIVAAAAGVLLQDGLASCTSRAVAEAAGISKGAIHYYFDSMEEIVDRAMGAIIDTFLQHLGAIGDPADPIDRFWQVVAAYVDIHEQNTFTILLWIDYWTVSARQGRLAPLRDLNGRIVDFFAGLLEPMDVPGPRVRAQALASYLLGTVMRQTVDTSRFEDLRVEIAAVAGLDGR